MDGFIGITENKLHHMLGVAEECYKLAINKGYDTDFAKTMYFLGFVHDIGYAFSKTSEEHPLVGAEIISNALGETASDNRFLHAIRQHGHYTEKKTAEWEILNTADLTIDSKGNKVHVSERLADIKSRYGEYSNQYLTACDIAEQVGLTKHPEEQEEKPCKKTP